MLMQCISKLSANKGVKCFTKLGETFVSEFWVFFLEVLIILETPRNNHINV